MRNRTSLFITISIIVIIAIVIFVNKHRQTTLVKETFDDDAATAAFNQQTLTNLGIESGLERCDTLMIQDDKTITSDDLSKNAFVRMQDAINGYRINKWKPKNNDEIAQKRPGHDYCFFLR